jgi:hypothetical protein
MYIYLIAGLFLGLVVLGYTYLDDRSPLSYILTLFMYTFLWPAVIAYGFGVIIRNESEDTKEINAKIEEYKEVRRR